MLNSANNYEVWLGLGNGNSELLLYGLRLRAFCLHRGCLVSCVPSMQTVSSAQVCRPAGRASDV